MNKAEILEKIKELGIMAVIRGPSEDLTVQMVDALIAGGVRGIEITYSTPNAESVARKLAKKHGDTILLGMGTLTEPAQVQTAKAAGANFLVSPICEPDLVKAMAASGLVIMAGALTPTEVLQAYRLGSDVVKLFPGSLVGPSYVKALHGPFPQIPLMPTGGVSAANVEQWFAAGVVAVGAGSELCPPALAKAGRFAEISQKAADFIKAVDAARASIELSAVGSPEMIEPTAPTSSYQIVTKTVPTFYFIGVTTGKSSIMKVFPLWMKELGKPEIVIEGIDHPMHDEPENYRRSVAQIKYDPLSLGALVTTHKINLLEAARNMFDYLDPNARICGEVSSISKLDGHLEGHAFDPITAGLSMDAIVNKDYFARTGGHVLCFGAGGSTVATALHLIRKQNAGDRPKKFVVINRSLPRLDGMRMMVETLNTDIVFEYIHNAEPKVNDTIMAGMPEGTIVINATGMGKDSPGSPITWDGLFPKHGIAWEFNYRGELDFMHQALAQRDSRNVFVEDGWLYFVHGWTQVVAQVLHVKLTPELFARLEAAAATVRK